MKRLRMAIFAGSLMLLNACSEQELYAQLTQRQANDIVAVLRMAGITSEKVALEGSLFAVTVPRDSFSDAVEVLRANGFPREGFDSMGQVFKKEGFVSSPLEERARLTHALSQEIANTLSNIDGVVMARVHLSVPEKDPLADKPPPAAASVFIKHRAGVDLSDQAGHIKALVVNSIQGLSYDNVTVVFFPAEPNRAHATSATASLGGLGTVAIGGAGLGSVMLAAGLGHREWRRRRVRIVAHDKPPGRSGILGSPRGE